MCEEQERANSVLQSDYVGTLEQNSVLTQDFEKSCNVTTLLQERFDSSKKKMKAGMELINELQEEKGDVKGELNEERRRFHELDTVHKQAVDRVKDLSSQLNSRIVAGRPTPPRSQAAILTELAHTQEELSCQPPSETRKQAARYGRSLATTSGKRAEYWKISVERTKRRDELIEWSEKGKDWKRITNPFE